MKLYEIPRGSKIKWEDEILTFHHLDGMYSLCTIDRFEEEKMIHLPASTPLRTEGDYYIIDDSDENPTN